MSGDFHNAFARIVGKEHVLTYVGSRSSRYRALLASFSQPPESVECVIQPGSVEELQQCADVASELELGVWTTPNAAGNGMMPGPTEGPAVFFDLQRMNRILDVSESGAYALVEPGVTFLQLTAYLQENGLKLWIDCDRNGNNSVAGSILSRQLGYTPYGDRMMMQCGMEVLLSDGSLVRTGTGAMPNDKTWQLFKRNFGPYIDGLFTDSTNAIVSKIGMWIMPEPPAYRPFMVTIPDNQGLAEMVDLLRPLKQSMAVPGTIVISHSAFDIAPYADRQAFLKDGKVDPAAISNAHGLGEWNLYGAFYGTDKLVDISWGGFSQALTNQSNIHNIPGR